jgi:hypothetical protein
MRRTLPAPHRVALASCAVGSVVPLDMTCVCPSATVYMTKPCAQTEDSSGSRRRSATAAFTSQPHIDSNAFLMRYLPAPRSYFLDLGQHLTDGGMYLPLHRRNGPFGAGAHGQPTGIDLEVIRDGKQASRLDALVSPRKPVRDRRSGDAAMTCQFSFASAAFGCDELVQAFREAAAWRHRVGFRSASHINPLETRWRHPGSHVRDRRNVWKEAVVSGNLRRDTSAFRAADASTSFDVCVTAFWHGTGNERTDGS